MEKWRKKNEFANNNKPQFNEFFLIYSFILDHKVFFFFLNPMVECNALLTVMIHHWWSSLNELDVLPFYNFISWFFHIEKNNFHFDNPVADIRCICFYFFIPGLIECLTDKIEILAIEWRRNNATNLYTSWNHSIRRTILWISTLSSLPRLTSFDVWRRRRCSLIATVCFALRCRSFENIKSIKLNFICI